MSHPAIDPVRVPRASEAAEDFDLDLVALVDEKTPELEQTLDEIAYNLMWDHDFKPIISLKVFAEERFLSAVAKGLSFYRNVERERLKLQWSARSCNQSSMCRFGGLVPPS